MATIKAEWARMQACSNEITTYHNLVSQYKGRVDSVKRSLSLVLCLQTNIDENLRQVSRRLDKLSASIQNLSGGLSAAALEYQKTEYGLQGKQVDGTEDKNTFPWWKIVKDYGVVGGLFSATGDLINDPSAKNIFGFGGAVLGAGGKLYDASKDKGTKWFETLFKRPDPLKDLGEGESVFGHLFKGELDKYNWTKATTTGKKIGVVAKWGTVAVSGVLNGISNYNEYKNGEISGERAVRETVMETGVDWGISVLSGVAVGALAAALPFAGGALVAGAVVVGVKWGADYLCKHFFGKGLTETVSDAVLDAGEWIADKTTQFVSTALDTAGNAIHKLGKAVTTKWKAIFG